jgi:hypothetical protein
MNIRGEGRLFEESNEFKYSVIRQYEKNDRPRLACANSCGVTRYAQRNTKSVSQEEDERIRFFIHYRPHSEQLVDALLEWQKKL